MIIMDDRLWWMIGGKEGSYSLNSSLSVVIDLCRVVVIKSVLREDEEWMEREREREGRRWKRSRRDCLLREDKE